VRAAVADSAHATAPTAQSFHRRIVELACWHILSLGICTALPPVASSAEAWRPKIAHVEAHTRKAPGSLVPLAKKPDVALHQPFKSAVFPLFHQHTYQPLSWASLVKMAAPRVSFGEKDMENGGVGAAERSRKWSQAPGNIEDLGEQSPFLAVPSTCD
jgi:hypothetical protein